MKGAVTADGRLFYAMSYLTVKVEIEHGHVLAKGAESLPEKASGLLAIFKSDALNRAAISPLQALESLQKHLHLDAAGAAEWMASVREARLKHRMAMLFVAALFCWSAFEPLDAQTNAFNVLYAFTRGSGPPDYIGNFGVAPLGGLILSGGRFYGTTWLGGSAGNGAVFRLNDDGSGITNLHDFTASTISYSLGSYTNSDGTAPQGGVIISGNTLYGTAEGGGVWGTGTVFRVNTDGSDFTNLNDFTSVRDLTDSDGAGPSGLVLSGNTLYGTTLYCGTNDNGTVFRVNTDGSDFTNLHNFAPGSEGVLPYPGNLILSGNTLYGATCGAVNGYAGTYGTVFSLKTDGSNFTNLYSFTNGSDGAGPYPALVLSSNTLYGTAIHGGSNGNGTVFSLNTNGSGFTNLHTFAATLGFNNNSIVNSDGAEPERGLVLSGLMIYGTTEEGGSSGYGTLFRMRNDGSEFATLYCFTNGSDGANPDGLLLSGNTLYGAAYEGGSGAAGTVFALTLALPALGIAPAGNQVVISWPDSVPNFVLQTATDLSSGSWSNISNGINTVGTNYVFINTVAGQTAFFRLQTP
jgi:uncharacterized repeat protein (TIGR03803 family)